MSNNWDTLWGKSWRIWSKQILMAGLKNKARRKGGGVASKFGSNDGSGARFGQRHSPRNKSTENGLNTDRPKKAPILALMVFKVHFAQMGRLKALWPLVADTQHTVRLNVKRKLKFY